jgi:hypothetical protein
MIVTKKDGMAMNQQKPPRRHDLPPEHIKLVDQYQIPFIKVDGALRFNPETVIRSFAHYPAQEGKIRAQRG